MTVTLHRRALAVAAASLISVASGSSHADDLEIPSGIDVSDSGQHLGGPQASGHAPIGVMGDHMHHKGEFMLSYRYMHMGMEGSRIGTRGVSPLEIATTVPNRFFGLPMQPPTLRVVPESMDMDMHMLGAMYAPTNWLTLMAMAPYIRKEMEHITFMGGAGPNVLGRFTTETEGFGDLMFTGLIRLHDDAINHFHLNLGLSAPTGSITERDVVLAPTGTTPVLRLPYAMQLGSGTWDLLPGLTYTGHLNDFSWGGQYLAEVRLEDENDEGYRLGNKHTVTGWLAYRWAPWISTSFRASYTSQDSIHGIDPNIVAPVQTANPDFYGGEKLELFGGINTVVTEGPLKGHRFALEIGAPVYQDLNGPQMETDWTLTAGWQYAF